MKMILTALAAAGIALSSGAAIAQSANIAVDDAFLGVDTDDNGQVSWAEFSLIYSDITEEQFNTADADGDGSLTQDEFDSLVLQTGSVSPDTGGTGTLVDPSQSLIEPSDD